MYSRELNPDYKVPTKKTVNKYLSLVYDECKEQLIGELAGQKVAVTTDLWTSIGARSYMTVTGHYIDDEWEMHSPVLGTRTLDDRHTGENIATSLHKIADEFGLTVTSIVTDNAGNMLTAASSGNFTRIACFAHTLQLSINEGLKHATVVKALATGKRLVGHFSHSAVATQALIEHQSRMGIERPLKLVQDVQTRWNSSLYMMERLLKLRVPLYAVICDDKVTRVKDRAGLDIQDSMWKVMEDLVPVLLPLAEATEMLTKEDWPTSSCIHVLVQALIQSLCTDDMDSVCIRDVKRKISSGLSTRFSVDEFGKPLNRILKSPPLIATFLDPRHKAMHMLSAEQCKILHTHIISLVPAPPGVDVQQPSVVKTEPTDVVGEPQPKRSLLSFICGDVVDLTTSPDEPGLANEIEYYIKECVAIPNPLNWWKLNSAKFPSLARLARSYLAMPATEVPSERVFSVAGLTVTKLRATLDPDNVDKIIFLHKNYKISEVGNVAAISAPMSPVMPTSTTVALPPTHIDPLPTAPGQTNIKNEANAPRLPSLF